MGREAVGAIVAELVSIDFMQRDKGIDYGAETGHGMGLIPADREVARLAVERFAEHPAGPA